jgi:transposase
VDKASLELLLAKGLSLAEIGRRFGKDPSTVGYWVRKHGLQAVNRERHLAKGAPSKETLSRLAADGYSRASMAEQLGRSETSIQYWLRKWGIRTMASVRREHAENARREGQAVARLVCRHHGLTDFWIEGRGSYRCIKCRGEWVARRRRKVKEILVAEAGGACSICGYDRSISALQFHHVDPARKSFSLGQQGMTRSIARMREEASKCVLLCANCHAEVEAGIVSLAVVSPPGRLPQTG